MRSTVKVRHREKGKEKARGIKKGEDDRRLRKLGGMEEENGWIMVEKQRGKKREQIKYTYLVFIVL